MKNLLLVFIILVASQVANAQSVSVSPASFNGWGNVTHTAAVSADYKDFGVHYFHVFKSKEYGSTKNGQVDIYSGKSQSAFGLSYVPMNIKNIFKLGVIVSSRKFPTDLSNSVNFWVEAGFNVRRLRVSYVHISNGFGVVNKVNPGLDTIRITVPLSKQ